MHVQALFYAIVHVSCNISHTNHYCIAYCSCQDEELDIVRRNSYIVVQQLLLHTSNPSTFLNALFMSSSSDTVIEITLGLVKSIMQCDLL